MTSTIDGLYDVAIVGYGPVGRLLALQLGRRGHSVLVVERQNANYFLPRAVHLDDEASRILQSVGASPENMKDGVEPYDDFYEWRSADLTTLMRLDWRGRGPSGWNVSNFFNQPTVERFLDEQVKNLPTVTLLNGWQATARIEHDDRVDLELTSTSESLRTVSARYVVGADGANSVVRQWIGGSTTDLGYFHEWLVVDLIMKNDFEFSPPAWQLCDPERPTTLVPGGPGRRRFEFMRLPDEDSAHLATTDAAWQLLARWGIGPADAELERNTVYTFQARYCDVWRRGRMLIAGDSAHLMPPFAGQGMCSGLRDAANLEWKLHLVLTGTAPEALLDTYGSERQEHVRHFITASMELGEVICITDREQARERDAALAADLAANILRPPRPLPTLGEGLHCAGAAGGTLSIQAVVQSESGRGLFDDVTRGGGTLLLASPAIRAELSADHVRQLSALGFQAVTLAAAAGPDQVVDIGGDYGRWLNQHSAVAALIRPDFYLYGVATTSHALDALVRSLLAELTAG